MEAFWFKTTYYLGEAAVLQIGAKVVLKDGNIWQFICCCRCREAAFQICLLAAAGNLTAKLGHV